MANPTRDSFNDTAGYTEVTFQRGEDVLDSELNELQKIVRSDRVKQLTTLQGSFHCHSNDNGGRVTADGVASNTLTIKAGTLVAAGYVVQFAADVVKTGLTTPGANLVTDVWLLVFESEVNSATDPNIAVSKLGETTVRQKVTTSLTFTSTNGFNSASSISSTGDSDPVPPYLGGAGKYVHLARVYRPTGVAVITQASIVDMRGRSLGAEAAQDRNLMIRGSGISWDGTTLLFATLVVRVPGEVGFFTGAAISVNPADGNAIGWLSTTAGNRFRRRFDGLPADAGATAGGNTDVLTTLAAFSSLAVADSQFAHNVLVVGVRDGAQIILRDGTVMNSGDYLHAWGQQGGVQATAEADVHPLLQFRASNGKARSLIDHNGYRMGQVTELDETWKLGAQRSQFFPAVPVDFGGGAAAAAPTTTLGSSYRLATAAAQADSPIGPLLSGTTVNSAVVFYNRTDGTMSYALVDHASSTPTTIVTKDVSAGTGNTTTSLGVSPTAGSLPFTAGDLTYLTLNAQGGPFTSGHRVYGVQLQITTDPPGWLWAPSNQGATGCKRAFLDPTASLNQRSVQLIGQGSGQSGLYTSEAYEGFLDASALYVQEWMLRTGTVSDASNTRNFAIGVQNFNAGAANRFVYFFNQNTTANWQVRVVGNTTNVDTNTGVAIAANTTYRMRLEVLGANVSSAGASSFRVRGFVNGVKVVDVITNDLPVADMIRPYMQCGSTGAGGPYDFTVGRMRRVWNHLLTQDAL